MKIPTTLKHKPVIVAENYDSICEGTRNIEVGTRNIKLTTLDKG